MAPNRQLDGWASDQLAQLTGFGGGELDQIVSHLVSLTTPELVAEFLTGMVGTESSALTFIAEFNDRRFPKMKMVGAWTAALKIPLSQSNESKNGYRKPPAESYMPGGQPKREGGRDGQLLSDKLRPSHSAGGSPASPTPATNSKVKKTKARMNIGEAAAALDDIDGMVKITLVHTKQRQQQSRKAKVKTGDGYVGAGYGRAAGAQIPSGFNKAAAAEVDPELFPTLMAEQDREALAKADAQRARLLDYQKNSVARTRVHDTASDFSYQEDAQNKWLSAEERALALRKAQEERQWAEDQKRRRVITLDLKNKRVTTAIQQNPFSKGAAPEAIEPEAHPPSENLPQDPGSSGQFRNPTIRIAPVFIPPPKIANTSSANAKRKPPASLPPQPPRESPKHSKKKANRPNIRRLQHDLEGFQEDEIYAQMELSRSELGTETTCG
ncbi:hypothetical protein HDU86_007960 [Geranomyces michiganensis]|nr:hypothetical protein HDU86_007960 [Geranomyces michiganensis]